MKRKVSNPDYNRYINSREWKVIRLQVLARDRYRCTRCKRARASHVHHLTYTRFKQELPEDLTSLCFRCHQLITRHHRLGRSVDSNPEKFQLP